MAPSQDASDHQVYEPFLVGNPKLNFYLPLLLGRGHTQHIYIYIYKMYPHLISHDIKLYQIIHVNPTKYTFQFGYLLSGADFFEFRHVLQSAMWSDFGSLDPKSSQGHVEMPVVGYWSTWAWNLRQFWLGILANGGWSHLQKVHSQTLTGAGTFTYICHENQNKKVGQNTMLQKNVEQNTIAPKNVGQYTIAPFFVALALIASSFIKGSNSRTLPWNVEYCYWKHSTLELKQRAPCQENN